MDGWVRELVIRICFLLAGVILALVYGGRDATGAEAAQAYRGADGQWHQHDPHWDGLWIANDFPSCCGKSDCFKDGAEVDIQRLEDGTGFIVTWAQPNGTEPTPEFIPYDSPVLRPSQDGEYWACHRLVKGNGTRSTRCLFIPPLGF
jgi:hypothetical protein